MLKTIEDTLSNFLGIHIPIGVILVFLYLIGYWAILKLWSLRKSERDKQKAEREWKRMQRDEEIARAINEEWGKKDL